MKIILQAEVEKLGTPGDIVEVKDGYARNYLVPRGMAIPATKGALKHAERVKQAHESRVAKAKGAAEELAGRIAATPVQIAAKAGEEGKLFGSVTGQEIAEALSAALGQEVDRHTLRLEDPIRSTGTHVVQVHLHPEVNADLTVQVVPQ